MNKKVLSTLLTICLAAFALTTGAQNRGSGGGGIRTDTRILYHNGAIMTATSNVYFIWYGNWTGRENTVNLLSHFSISYGNSPYARINTTYSNASGATPTGGLIYGGAVNDLYSRGATLTEADVEEVVTNQIFGGGLPIDPRGIYLVLASPDIYFEGFCTDRCQYHEYLTLSGTNLKYGIVGNPDRCPTSCAAQFPGATISPNADRAGDAMVSWIAHVLNETITNPYGTGWFDRYGLETSDKCQGTYGETYLTATGASANMRLNGRDYLIQQNWVNDRKGRCALSYP